MMITAATTAVATFLPMTNCWNSVVISCGMREMMLMVRTMEIPLPTPLSVIRSPSHIRNAEPAVSVAMTVMTLIALKVWSRPFRPKPIAMAADSIRESAIVR